jgi:subtilisin family serine protease
MEPLEERTVLSSAGVLDVSESSVPVSIDLEADAQSLTSVPLAGDANLDGAFSHLDIMQVLQAGRYLSGEPADWTQGDWNHDGLFNQLDIVEALQTGSYQRQTVAPHRISETDGGANAVGALGKQQFAPSVYIALMSGDPIVAYDGDIEGLPATKPGKGQKVNPNSAHVKKYDQHLETMHRAALQSAGADLDDLVYSYTFALNGFAAELTEQEAAELAKQPGVVSVQPDELRQVLTDSSPTFLGLDAAGGPWLKGFDGESVVVGVIDSGIWPEHPSFADDGSYPSPFVTLEDTEDNPACDFGNTDHNPNDAPFTCNNKLIGAREMLDAYEYYIGLTPDEYDSARDDDGHGTHTASTAAGNADVEASLYGIPRGTVSGIAPRAQVIAYKAIGDLGGFSSDLAAAIDQAVADGVDVINFSVGGGPQIFAPIELAFLFAADAGVFAATSAGNSGPGPGTIGGPASVPWITSVGASTQSRFYEGTVTLGDGSQFSGASVTAGTNELPLVDAASAGSDLCEPGALNPALVSGKIVLCRGSVNRAAKSFAVSQAGGAGMILYNDTDDGNLFSDTHWVPSVHVDHTPGMAIKSYIASSDLPTAKIAGGTVTQWDAAPSMTIFSSRGPDPVAEDIIKPDVTAPGIQVLAGNSPTPDAEMFPGQLFQAIAGTSMSSPHVAGVFALLKQAHPDWSPAMAKSAVMTTAYQDVRDNDRVSPADPFAMGAGHIDAGGKWNKGSVDEPGLVYDAGFYEYLGFLCDAAPEAFANPAATCSFLASIGVPTDASDLNLPSIGVAELVGQQTVVRTVTSVAAESGWRQYTAVADPPPGFDVTVSPSKIRLKSGDKATYEVTITNVSAPIGQWAFGSLTWQDDTGHYDVYSPIAVRPSRFEAPYEVSDAGTGGSLSFGVKFGYSGDYTAAAHGLEPATVTSDTVVQDPDQDFDPVDRYSNAHSFVLSDTAHFRVALPPDSTESGADLDLFVFDPDGNLAATSTNSYTDELAEIPWPMDGTWTVYVHGWLTPDGDSDYDLSTWAVSATAGGSLGIDSAPSSATLGQLGTVTLSWSGLTADTEYLGAVSHSDNDGLLGLTLVSVET